MPKIVRAKRHRRKPGIGCLNITVLEQRTATQVMSQRSVDTPHLACVGLTEACHDYRVLNQGHDLLVTIIHIGTAIGQIGVIDSQNRIE